MNRSKPQNQRPRVRKSWFEVWLVLQIPESLSDSIEPEVDRPGLQLSEKPLGLLADPPAVLHRQARKNCSRLEHRIQSAAAKCWRVRLGLTATDFHAGFPRKNHHSYEDFLQRSLLCHPDSPQGDETRRESRIEKTVPSPDLRTDSIPAKYGGPFSLRQTQERAVD
jgi:hypothetical protein